MRRIVLALSALALSASFAHATNRIMPPTTAATRCVPPLKTSFRSHRPNTGLPLKSQRPEVPQRYTRRPNLPGPTSKHKVSVGKIRSQLPLISVREPVAHFPTPTEPE